ncbi:hypothetical protein FGE12_21160 [Aggregicoccus sp. 17bor-14]|uniref:hypothetical protein n=1 Tax=Myxococcaceae TaxID=31 RepID=UPI00129C2E4C|nr:MULTISPECIES: hypothetical protein [Myxococcaceae]MBF5044924.1 hypothetical protein [Simulacricoccus sp. 17bor-14]MRI90667.1 hypothetical protein [Aggregicoccus sp. 17bor-14]
MRQVLLRALALLRRPAVLLLVLLLAGGGSALVALPLFGVPGFELGLALSLGVGLLGGGVGIAAAFQERRLIQGRDPRPKGALREDGAVGSAWVAACSAMVLNTAVLVPPLVTSVLFALLSTACSPFALLGFYPLLTLPSAALAAAAGVFCGFWARGAGRALGLYALLVALSLVLTVWPLVAGPQVYAYNHFLGFLPGPLYDEALQLTAGMLWFRLQTLLLAALLWLLAAFFLDMREGRLRRPHVRPGAFVLLGLVAFGVAALEERAPSLGTRMTEGYLAERLGGERLTPHFRIVYPRGKDKLSVDRLARDLEFRHTQLAQYLGVAPVGRITVWVYRSDEEKRQLVGAGRTQFAKPWRQELHVGDRPFPHPTLKHELAHVMAAPAGSGPFKVAAVAGGLWPLMGIIEGLAVSADDPVQGGLTLHEWAAGMRKQGLAPDLRTILGPKGFYQAAPARAYTLVGSFLRHLADTYGAEKLRALYAHGDLEGTYGRSTDALVTEWEKMLDALPLDEAAVARALLRFRTPSLFARSCAREVARLSSEAAEFLASDPEQALARYERCSALQPDEPGFELGAASALERLDRKGEAAQRLRQLAARVKGQDAQEAEVQLAVADLALSRERPEEARAALERALQLAATPEATRTAQVKLAALESPARARAIGGYFRQDAEELRLLRLALALEQLPRDPYLHYLLGRRLAQAGAPRLALEHLAQALAPRGGEEPLPAEIRREALRLQVQSAYEAGDCGAVRHEVGALPELGRALLREAQEWQARCDFEDRQLKGPLVPEEAFR